MQKGARAERDKLSDPFAAGKDMTINASSHVRADKRACGSVQSVMHEPIMAWHKCCDVGSHAAYDSQNEFSNVVWRCKK